MRFLRPKTGSNQDDAAGPALLADAVVVFAIALAYRLAYLFEVRLRPDASLLFMDAEYHFRWAQAIASGVWAAPFDTVREAAFFRAPLYPYFLAGVFDLFGTSPTSARVVQAAIGSLSCVLVYLLGRRLFDRRVGLLSGLACGLYWVFAYFDGELLIPVLLVFLATLGFLLLFVGLDRESVVPGAGRAAAAGGGLAFGLFAIARPNILLFFPVLLTWLVWQRRRDVRAVSTGVILLVAAGCALPPLAVTARNYLVAGDVVVVASQGGVNFYIGNNPESNGMQAVVPGTRRSWWGGYEDTLEIAERDERRELRPSEVSSYWYRRSVRYIREQPVDWLSLTGRKVLAFAGNAEIPNNAPYEARRAEFVTLRSVPLGFGLFLGLFLCALPALLGVPGRWTDAPLARATAAGYVRLLVAFVGVYALSVVLFFVTGRYRLPITPFVVLGAAAFGIRLYERLRSGEFRSLAAGGLAATVWVALLHADPLQIRRSTEPFAQMSAALDRIESGRPAEAIPILERMRSSGQVREASLYSTLARIYLGRNAPGDRPLALAVVDEGLGHYPADAELLWLGTAVFFETGDPDRAQLCVDAYLVDHPAELRAHYAATRIRLARGDREGALRHLQRASEIAPGSPYVQQLRKLLGTP